MTSTAEYNNAVVVLTVFIAIKAMLISLLIVRARVMTGFYNFRSVESENPIGRLLEPVMSFTKIFNSPTHTGIEILERTQLNNVSNEPFFLALAICGCFSENTPSIFFVKGFIGARLMHNIGYLALMKIGPALRTVSYICGMIYTIIVAVQLVL